ncbi:hypothetical protein CHY_0464 [Carboxydothermus hydrogenoformans Z-2901]|uniref:Uncharacterized protein n=1 Tax=Carboxydothermus hydrogenoformans (strain ATCC BAA-161 / DSM 6008 / Z-2901) TaxID=246194 RepID=Q3AEW2_CARHZ|nr:hypothetical protein CHY_0464 [Carboxydothermus hydrogenoformans Z-2901]
MEATPRKVPQKQTALLEVGGERLEVGKEKLNDLLL